MLKITRNDVANIAGFATLAAVMWFIGTSGAAGAELFRLIGCVVVVFGLPYWVVTRIDRPRV